MDRIALEILKQELAGDARVLTAAARTAADRLADDHPGHLEACGYEVNRVYNVLEKAFERICIAFENHFEKRGGYHEVLIERMRLDLPGIRPGFLPPEAEPAIRDLKGFRHVFRHAYELNLRADRLAPVVDHAVFVADAFPKWCQTFIAEVGQHLDTG